jgi:hypothetical protein
MKEAAMAQQQNHSRPPDFEWIEDQPFHPCLHKFHGNGYLLTCYQMQYCHVEWKVENADKIIKTTRGFDADELDLAKLWAKQHIHLFENPPAVPTQPPPVHIGVDPAQGQLPIKQDFETRRGCIITAVPTTWAVANVIRKDFFMIGFLPVHTWKRGDNTLEHIGYSKHFRALTIGEKIPEYNIINLNGHVSITEVP